MPLLIPITINNHLYFNRCLIGKINIFQHRIRKFIVPSCSDDPEPVGLHPT